MEYTQTNKQTIRIRTIILKEKQFCGNEMEKYTSLEYDVEMEKHLETRPRTRHRATTHVCQMNDGNTYKRTLFVSI